MQSEAKAKALEQFTDYFVRNYPGPDTIIYDPKWHAPKIFAAAYSAISAALSDKQAGEVKIKPLEFNDDPCPAAVCVFGHYVINPIYSHVELLIGYGRMSMTSLGRVQLNPGASIDDLQTAAQADYDHRIRSALVDVPAVEPRKFKLGDHVCKTKGSSWVGHVVGFYSTELTPVGYAVESSRERGSVQIYPEAALKLIDPASPLREGEDSAGRIPGATAAFRAIDVADRLIQSAYGDEVPSEWNKAFRSVAKARGRASALAATRSASATTAKGVSE